LTEWYWKNVSPGVPEATGFVGLSALFLCYYAFKHRKRLPDYREVDVWFIFLIFFFVMSLGPALKIYGVQTPLSLPYQLLEKSIPPLRVSGVPIRMILMAILSVSVLCAFAVRLFENKWALGAILLVAIVESLPAPLARTSIVMPRYVEVLRDLPGNSGVLDVVSGMSGSMYFQTHHEKPIAFGYVGRVPRSLLERSKTILDLLAKGDVGTLRERYRFGFLVLPPAYPRVGRLKGLKPVYSDRAASIYALAGVD
jgi:hypothetical protein